MFGGIERESGKTFLVPIPDRTADTLMAVIDAWIKPVTTFISDCWGGFHDPDAQGYTNRTPTLENTLTVAAITLKHQDATHSNIFLFRLPLNPFS